jgi:hypothetical protein
MNTENKNRLMNVGATDYIEFIWNEPHKIKVYERPDGRYDVSATDVSLDTAEKIILKAKEKPVWRSPLTNRIPRYTPITPLPKDAVLLDQDCNPDWYWIPTGKVQYVTSRGETGVYSFESLPFRMAREAISLGLPILGDGLQDGEEALSFSVLEDMARDKKLIDCLDATIWSPFSCYVLGLENLRKWKHGWIVKRVPEMKDRRKIWKFLVGDKVSWCGGVSGIIVALRDDSSNNDYDVYYYATKTILGAAEVNLKYEKDM